VRKDGPVDLPRHAQRQYAAAVDPSEANASGNAFTLVVVERAGSHDEARFRTALVREFRVGSPSDIWREIAAHCKRYGVTEVVSDQWGGEAQREIARQQGITLRKRTTTAKSKLEDFQNLATLLHTDRLELTSDKQLLDDLRSIRLVTTQSGQSIHLPRTGDGRHCDYAPALAAALRGAWHSSREQDTAHEPVDAWLRGAFPSRFGAASARPGRGNVPRTPKAYAFSFGETAARRYFGLDDDEALW
jgi:hypothetical protein